MSDPKLQSLAALIAVMIAVALSSLTGLFLLGRLEDARVQTGLLLIILLGVTACALTAVDWKRRQI